MPKRPDTADFRQLFLNDAPLIDTRAPVEFAQGAFPNAVNLPLMGDDERAQVGLCYKRRGQAAAIALGHELVQGALKASRVQAWLDFAHRHPDGYLYCFRGGLRSQTSQQWLAEAGCDYPRIVGGYKAMRRFLLQALETSLAQGPILVLSGQTGCAKTQLLHQVAGAVDLEGLARHRGSAFGKRVGGQPSQIDFENALSVALLKQRHAAIARPVVVEDESHLIGRIVLPDVLLAAMRQARIVLIETGLEQRVEHTYQNYILHKLLEWQGHAGEREGFARFAEELQASLSSLKRRLGGWRHQQLQALMQSAIDAHLGGNPLGHKQWIRVMLQEYYDPMYAYQLERKADRVAFKGSYGQVLDYLARAASH
jgi:tRNA 2-selenouridine synthase